MLGPGFTYARVEVGLTMRCHSLWCALCYEGARGRRYHKGHCGFVHSSSGRRSSQVFTRYKGPVREASNGAGQPLAHCDWSRRYVTLFAFLTDDRWDDGSEREPGTMLLCSGEGRVRIWLHSRSEGLSAWLSGGTFEEAFGAAETALAAGNVEWRRSKKPTRRS
jgi:hypothetical protein